MNGTVPAVPPGREDQSMRTKRSRRLPNGRVLTWIDVWRRAACSTVEDYNTDGKADGVPIGDDELRRLILGR